MSAPTRLPVVPSNGNTPLSLAESQAREELLRPEEHVLTTLRADGSRSWISPRLAKGIIWERRRIVAYILIAIFTLLPHLRLSGKPLLLLDITSRRFTILGYTFLPTDTIMLALLMLSVFLSIFFLTALFGRVWCGWACPHTVYMEFLFRPIDRLFEGTVGKGGKPKRAVTGPLAVGRFVTYVVLCGIIANTFLAYFIGTDRLWQWMQHSPINHPVPFLVMFVATAAMTFHGMYFREQLCFIACPYGRFQSVMLDRRSLMVTYDYQRGEPRGKGKRHTEHADATGTKGCSGAVDGNCGVHTGPCVGESQCDRRKTVNITTLTAKFPSATESLPIALSESQDSEVNKGSCIDCALCVQVCPSGIDIRNGLQMECIQCGQCIDACNTVMRKQGMDEGLIRYSNQDAVAKKTSATWMRPRLLVYPVLLTISVSALVTMFVYKKEFDARIYRNLGNSFSVGESGLIDNSLKLSLTNRTDEMRSYDFKLEKPVDGRVRLVEHDAVTLKGTENHLVPILISAPFEDFTDAACPIELRITDDHGESRLIKYNLLGPYQKPKS